MDWTQLLWGKQLWESWEQGWVSLEFLFFCDLSESAEPAKRCWDKGVPLKLPPYQGLPELFDTEARLAVTVQWLAGGVVLW